jgi:HAE1 family hydrophobic/amphiphilic exporter-1
MGEFMQYRNASIFAFAPPSVIELGTANGFDFQLLDRGGLGHAKLMDARNQLLGMIAQEPRLTRVRPNGLEDVRSTRLTSTGTRPALWACRSTRSTARFRRPSAAPTSTTSSRTAASSRSTSKTTRPTGCCPKISRNSTCATPRAKWLPFASFATGYWTYGSPKLERFNAFPSLNTWVSRPKDKVPAKR